MNDIDRYPAGVTDQTINDEYGEKPACYECKHCIPLCCDFGVCKHALLERFGTLVQTVRVAEWLEDNLVDMQEDICGRFERDE